MRIGVVVSEANPTTGGGFSFQHSILKALPSLNSQHQFIILSRAEGHDYLNDDGIKVVGIHPNRKPWSSDGDQYFPLTCSRYIKFVKSAFFNRIKKTSSAQPDSLLARAVKYHRIDIVWFLSPDAESVPCPMFVTVWDLQHRCQPWFPEVNWTGWDWQSREDNYQFILPRATKVVTGTQVGKEEITRFYRLPPDNVIVAPFFSPANADTGDCKNYESVRDKYNISSDFFLYPAQFWPHKNHANLVKAVAIAIKTETTFPSLVLTGSDKGNLSYIKEMIHRLDLKNHIHILGFIPDEDLVTLYHCAEGLVFPTFFGPDNLPPLEAFAYGCPVMASEIPGSKEQLKDAALFFNPANPSDIAKTMIKLHRDDTLQQNLRKLGKQRISNYTVLDYIRTIIKHMDEMGPIVDCWETSYKYK